MFLSERWRVCVRLHVFGRCDEGCVHGYTSYGYSVTQGAPIVWLGKVRVDEGGLLMCQ